MACILATLLAASSFAQSAGYRTRDRRSNARSTIGIGTARAIGQFPARSLPAEFAILQTRTIFARDRMAAQSSDSLNRDQRPLLDNRPSSIFRGVLNEGGSHLAGIEQGTSSIAWYREGQLLSGGDQVTQISLDQITITHRNGDHRIVAVGESVDAGVAVARESDRAIATTQPAASPLTRGDDLDPND